MTEEQIPDEAGDGILSYAFAIAIIVLVGLMITFYALGMLR